jgi:cytochrome b subunit of formate dehydrogenase
MDEADGDRGLNRRVRLIARAAVVAALFLIVAGARAAAPPKEVCFSCHSVPGLEKTRGGKTVSLQIDGAAFEGSVHAAFGCGACHSDATSVPHAPELKPVDCGACHGETVQVLSHSVHGKARANGFAEAPTCKSCHGDLHRVKRSSEPESLTNRANIANACASCHADEKIALKFRIPIVRPVEAYLKSVHARAVAAGKNGAVCTDCHGSHGIEPGWDPKSSVWRANIPATCGKCHADIQTAYRESVHGVALARGVRDAPACTDCHGEHRILAPSEPESPVFAANIPGETCGRCHGDARLSEKYGIPLDKVRAYQDSYHGLALRGGKLTVANCSSCHGVHDIRASSDPRSHVNAANLPQTCGKCHPGAGVTLALTRVHVLPTESEPVLYWIRFVYLWIIALVVGGMLLHNLLDFVKKARNGAPHHHTAAPPSERMPRLLRWQHGLIMVSFPVLVYTGFALTYPETWWAAPLVAWEARIGIRGLLHRIVAVVLVAGLLWHVISLIRNPRLRECLLGGLMFRFQDLRDMIRLQRYNLGLEAERPRFGRFSYIEKAEYWALMWGMVVMAVTGMLLWFNNATLRYLSNWITDIATAFHFYEAVLATLAIVVWHFYWTIFDPDVYPMDASWWHGRAPAARQAERGEPAPPPEGEKSRAAEDEQ